MTTDLQDLLLASMPLCGLLGIRADSAAPERVVLLLDWAPELCTVENAMHGGALMALADSAGAICAFLNLPDGAAGTSTIQSSTNLVRAVRSGTVRATSQPVHTGRSTIVVETQVSMDDRLVSTTTQVQSVLYPPSDT
jgi:uncharacterized protein (TIGR00369 family)